jgi:hypothetical protein
MGAHGGVGDCLRMGFLSLPIEKWGFCLHTAVLSLGCTHTLIGEMTEDPIVDHMDYAGLTQAALRSVIRQAVLRATTPEGLPGEHHFYITFLTHAPGVSIPEDLMQRYPHDMTIVLQHQFRDLRVTDDIMRVTLSFGGIPRILTVPFKAITRFQDPYAQFALQFESDSDFDYDEVEEEAEAEAGTSSGSEDDKVAEPSPAEVSDEPKVVSLDQFRKK